MIELGKYYMYRNQKVKVVGRFYKKIIIIQFSDFNSKYLLPTPINDHTLKYGDKSKGCLLVKDTELKHLKKTFPNNQLFKKIYSNHIVVCDKFIEVDL